MNADRVQFRSSVPAVLCWLPPVLFALANSAGASEVDLVLPENPIVADIAYTPAADTTFSITLEGVGDGYDVANSVYGGWCVENNGNPTHFEVMLYSSYDSTMPSGVAFYESNTIPAVAHGTVALGEPVPWDKLNYLLNHKQGGREDIQAAIWQLIWGDTSTLDLTPTAWAMLDEANNDGDGYVPGTGGIVAVILYVDGLQQDGYQETVIEVPVPPPALGAIGDWVWEDTDQDGRQDTDETGVAGVTVSLLASGPDGACETGDESWIASTVTDADGYYLFDDLPEGPYCVKFLPPANWQFTTPNQGDRALDSDADPSTGATDTIALDAGEIRLDVDAGLIQEPCEPGGPTTFVLAYRDAEGALSTVRSDTGLTEPLRAGGDPLATGLSGTTTAAYNAQEDRIYLATGEGDDALYALDPANGDLTYVGPLTGGASNLQAMDFAPAPAVAGGFTPGALYGISIDGMAGCGPNCLFQIDATTGAATPIAALAANQIRGASFDPVTGNLWVYDPGGKILSTVTADGSMTQRMRVPDSFQEGHTGVDTVFSLAHGCDGTLYAIDIAYGVLVRFDLEAQQAFWVADYGSAASAFGSFEGNGLDAIDPELCVCDPVPTPTADDSPGGGTTVEIEPASPDARSAPACSTGGSSGQASPLWVAWVLTTLPWVRYRRRRY